MNPIDIIRQHHGQLNGTGFPSGKKGEQISKLAKIVMVADEGMTSCATIPIPTAQ
ncbi:MAG: HD domain-containing phosphohydrolase [Nitrospirales bacterium]|nr:HD domain-containing protein [Nitrospirales bacterium]